MMRAGSMANRRFAMLVDDHAEAPDKLTFVVPMKRAAEASLPIQELIAISRAFVAVSCRGSPLLIEFDHCQRWLPAVR